MASQKQNPLITEELKNIVSDYECTPRFYPAFSIWIENMDLNEYKYEDGKKQTVELIWEMDGNNCDTIYTIQKGDDEDDLSDTSDTEELDEYLNR